LSAISILVFGAGGQLGSELVARPHSKDISFQFVRRADAYIDDPAAVRRAMQLARPSLVLNAAAYTNVDQAEIEREAAFRGNAAGPKVLAAACAEKDIPLIHLSTDYVFDGRKPSAYVEDDKTSPINVYGESKLAGEIRGARGIRPPRDPAHVMAVRRVWTEFHEKPCSSLPPSATKLRVVADQRGLPDRDRRSRRRHCGDRAAARGRRAAFRHLSCRKPACGDLVRCRAGDRRSRGAVHGRSPKVVPIKTQDYPTKAARPVNSELDSSKFFSTFGFRAADWRNRVREAVAALKGRPEAELS
jgi:dTDP-4-dehydrorhamnose reductase